jgi:hypothetical protein
MVMVMVKMMIQGWCRIVMMMMVVHRSRRLEPAMVEQTLVRHRHVVVATMVPSTRSMCHQLSIDRHRRQCMMVMTVVMRARSINIMVVVRARRVKVVAVARCGRRNQKQLQQRCQWHSQGIHGDTSAR